MKKFAHKLSIGLRDTDATGVLYFADQFKMVLQVFEAFLTFSELPLKIILSEGKFLIPIVHAESDYFAPLLAGDEVEIVLVVAHIGTTSFTCSYEIFDPLKELLVGRASLVHVALCTKTKKSIAIPAELKQILLKIVQTHDLG